MSNHIRPELLQHPNIPKPLHKQNPRSIMGKTRWDIVRQKAYKQASYCCNACGIYKLNAWPNKWLECHEDYTIDYEKGIVDVVDFVALCPACHKFIHSGRLSVAEPKSLQTKVIQHGWNILSNANMYMSFVTHYLISLGDLPTPKDLMDPDTAKAMGYKFGPDWEVTKIADWSEWRLIFEGNSYKSLYKNMDEWKLDYSQK